MAFSEHINFNSDVHIMRKSVLTRTVYKWFMAVKCQVTWKHTNGHFQITVTRNAQNTQMNMQINCRNCSKRELFNHMSYMLLSSKLHHVVLYWIDTKLLHEILLLSLHFILKSDKNTGCIQFWKLLFSSIFIFRMHS